MRFSLIGWGELLLRLKEVTQEGVRSVAVVKLECHHICWSAMFPTYPTGQPILGMGSVSPTVNATAAAFLWDGRAGYSLYRSAAAAAATSHAPEIDYRRRGLMGSAAAGDVGGSAETGGPTSLRLATMMSPLHQIPILVSRDIIL
ncbi:MAG: hypothetical protein CRN43_19040 [Candidatus Nephrothrix sp. EaCA]|nr:MAG: hypothetical protein CRN43_19040 [Candidatus Nephrothrix sp. EaCA]